MLFKRSLGLTRSLFILDAHEHDCLGSGMLTMETIVIPGLCLIAVSGAGPENSERGSRVSHCSPRMKTSFFRGYSIQHCGRIQDAQ